MYKPDGSSQDAIPERDTVNHAISFVVLPRTKISILHKIGFSGGYIDDWGFNTVVTKSNDRMRIYSDSAMLGITLHEKHLLGLSDYYIDVAEGE